MHKHDMYADDTVINTVIRLSEYVVVSKADRDRVEKIHAENITEDNYYFKFLVGDELVAVVSKTVWHEPQLVVKLNKHECDVSGCIVCKINDSDDGM